MGLRDAHDGFAQEDVRRRETNGPVVEAGGDDFTMRNADGQITHLKWMFHPKYFNRQRVAAGEPGCIPLDF
jgi:hypothetical protein